MLAALTVQPAYAQEDELKVHIPVPLRAATASTVEQAKEKVRKVPGSVAVVDAETFDETRAVSTKDMLEFTPGVLAQQKVNEEGRLAIRGSGLSRNFHLRGIGLYQDGIPINLADGSADFQDVDPLALRYVEVLKGANAMPLGTATMGGAINYVTPTGYDASPFSLRGELGSFGYRREQISSGDAVDGTDYFFSLTDQHSDGFRQQSTADNLRFNSNIGRKLNDALETRFYFAYADVNQELPGNLTKAQMRNNPRRANATNAAQNYQRDFELYRIANKTSWRGDGMEVNGGVYTQHKNLYHPIFQIVDQQSATYGVFGDVAFDGAVAGKQNRVTVATHLSQGDTDAKRFTNLAGDYGPLQADASERAKNATLYVENRTQLSPDVSVLAGNQFLYANRDFHDRFMGNGDQSAQRDYYGLSPRIGAIWDVDARTQLFTNLSRAYEAPIISELTQQVPGFAGFADLDAQKSDTLEIGSRGAYGRWQWDASIYRSWVKDELMMYNIAPNTSRVLNADRTIHQGLELGLDGELIQGVFLACGCDSLRLRLGYTYSDFHFDGDALYGDNQLPGAPEHYLRAELRYQHRDGWYIAPNVEAIPDGYPVDMANSLYTSGYALAGLRAGMDVTDKVELYLDARNLLDKTYAATADVITAPTAMNQAVFAPGDGRALYAGLRYRF